MTGPLRGLKVLEAGGVGPVPFAAMMLADMGADVIRIDRITAPDDPTAISRDNDVLARGRRSIALDLKHEQGAKVCRTIAESVDVLLEGFRPGVMERLGLGPQDCTARNPRLVYGRMTGWGQSGPRAHQAGHDINYIASAGALYNLGDVDRPPVPPMSYVGDFGGGAMFLLFGVLCAFHEALRSGRGQVVDAAMMDGAAVLTAPLYGMLADGTFHVKRGSNRTDGSAPHYTTYECSDGEYVAFGAQEPKFYRAMCDRLGLTGELWDDQFDASRWPERKAIVAAIIRQRTRSEWRDEFEHVDACFAPVLSLAEARHDPQMAARHRVVEHHGVVQPAPAPQLSVTPGELRLPPPRPGEHSLEVLGELGLAPDTIDRLVQSGAVRQAAGRGTEDPSQQEIA